MLKKIRTVIAAIVFALITLLFLDFTGTLHTYLGWLAKIQFLPAVLALNFVVVAVLLLVTLAFGRIYCSIICPLGIMQDVLARLNRKKNKYSYSKAKNVLRVAVLVVFVVAFVAGAASLASLLAPYSSFGRIAQNLLQPVYIGVNNVLAIIAERTDSYMFYSREVWVRAMPTFIVAAVTFVIIAVLAIRGGRTYCNTICPVGTVLGFVARYSRMKVVIDADACKNCGKCAKNCKASCIDFKNHKVDYSRCVVCGNCLGNCSFNAISYGHKPTIDKENKVAADYEAKKTDTGRRSFLIGAGIAVTAAALAQEKKKLDGGLAVIEDKKIPQRKTAILPPGALSAQHFAQHCTACQLCVSECPNDVLRPSTDLSTFMQPKMEYDRGYCRVECNRCSNVCPTGAIKPITLAEKSSTQIGHAVLIMKNCVSAKDEAECGNCARHCPTGAIQMVHLKGDETQPMVPAINESRCIGCGACENLCPSRPLSAIYVEGHEAQRTN